MKTKKIRGEIFLLLASLIWGTSLISQKMGMDHMGPFAFSAFRFIIGGLFIFCVSKILKNIRKKFFNIKSTEPSNESKKLVRMGGLFCGLALFFAASLQQIGLITSNPGKAGFLTTFYIITVPILSVFLHKKIDKIIWVSVLIALPGIYLLSVKNSFNIELGDTYVLISTIFWAIQIIIIDSVVNKVDLLKLTYIQFFVCGTISAIVSIVIETTTLKNIYASSTHILYTSILVVGVAYTLQLVGQKTTSPSVTALIMSFEAVFSVIFSAIILQERLTTREIIGCALMMLSILITQFSKLKPYFIRNKTLNNR